MLCVGYVGENQSPQCTPQPVYDGANVQSAVSAGYIHNHAVPTSPLQQQPQWTLPPYSRGMFMTQIHLSLLTSEYDCYSCIITPLVFSSGAINEFVPDAAAQERSIAPQVGKQHLKRIKVDIMVE